MVVMLDSFEQGLMVRGLLNYRNELIGKGDPAEDIAELILKIIDAPTKRKKCILENWSR